MEGNSDSSEGSGGYIMACFLLRFGSFGGDVLTFAIGFLSSIVIFRTFKDDQFPVIYFSIFLFFEMKWQRM